MSHNELPPRTSPSTRIAGHRLVSLPDDPVRVWHTLTATTCRAATHDTLTAYTEGCRCPTAIRENSRYAKRIRARRNVIIDADLAAKQLCALAAIGHSCAQIASHIGIGPDAVMAIRAGRQPHVKRSTAKHIEAYYRAYRNTPGRSQRSRTEATRHGWPPPSPADLTRADDVKVRRVLDGNLSPRLLNAAERALLREQNPTDTSTDNHRQEASA